MNRRETSHAGLGDALWLTADAAMCREADPTRDADDLAVTPESR